MRSADPTSATIRAIASERLAPDDFVVARHHPRATSSPRSKRDEILARLVEHEVPCGPILEPDEVLENEQIVANDMIVEWEHPTAGPVRQPRQPIHFSKTPGRVPASVPDAPVRTPTPSCSSSAARPDEIAALRAAEVIG